MVQLPRFLPHSRCTRRRTIVVPRCVRNPPINARPAPQTVEDMHLHTRRLCIREVARELAEDMELGAERDLNAAAPSTASFPPPRPPQLASHRRRALTLSPWSASCSLSPWSLPLSPANIAHTRNGSMLNGSLLGPASHACNGLNKIGRLCRLVPPVRAESKH